MFVYHLAEQSHNAAKADSKPRRNVQYKDVGMCFTKRSVCIFFNNWDIASVVARYDNLEFLADVVPRTVTYRQYKEKKAAKEASKAMRSLPTGQTTLDGKHLPSGHTTEQINPSSTMMDDGTVSPKEGSHQTGIAQPANGVSANADLVFEHYEPNGDSKHDESSDIEMQ